MKSRLLTSQTTPSKPLPTSIGTLVWRRLWINLSLRKSIGDILREMWCGVVYTSRRCGDALRRTFSSQGPPRYFTSFYHVILSRVPCLGPHFDVPGS
jgi:hypothetical protein